MVFSQALKTKTAPSSSIQKPVSGSGQKNGSQRNEIFVDILERCVCCVRPPSSVQAFRAPGFVCSCVLVHLRSHTPTQLAFHVACLLSQHRLSVLFSQSGQVVNSSIDGCIQMKSYLSGERLFCSRFCRSGTCGGCRECACFSTPAVGKGIIVDSSRNMEVLHRFCIDSLLALVVPALRPTPSTVYLFLDQGTRS